MSQTIFVFFPKRFRAIAALAIAIFFVVISSPFSYSQSTPSPSPNKTAADVFLSGQSLFTIQTSVGSFSPTERANVVTERIQDFARDLSIPVSDLKIEDKKATTNITLNNKVLVTITEADAMAVEQPRSVLAKSYLKTLQTSITQYRRERSKEYILFGVLYAAIATVVLLLLLFLLNKLFPRLYHQLQIWRETRIPALRIQNLQILSAAQISELLISVAKLFRFFLMIGLLSFYFTLTLSFFPWTKNFVTYVLAQGLKILDQARMGFIDYLPSLFVIGLVILITYYILKFLKFFLRELGRSNVLSWFYPEWAQPTYRLLVVLVIALALVVIFPYLPGFQSPAFQGISLFLGVLFSLGSTAAVANVVAGIILIYTRAFQVGDRVKVSDVTGDVADKSLLVTRILTVNNVLITIPNSTLLGSNIINYSGAIRDSQIPPLILHTTVTLGYDVPWRKVHEVLKRAAQQTEHVMTDPAPFVLQTSLDDFYVSYEVKAFTQTPNIMARIYSELHQNIQDLCNEADIEILSPHYSAIRDGHHSTIPQQYLPDDYNAPGFRLEQDSSS